MESSTFYVASARFMENGEVPRATVWCQRVRMQLRCLCQQTLIQLLSPSSAPPTLAQPSPALSQAASNPEPPTPTANTLMTAPVPWSLAWSEDGELAPQDRFDLLQSLVQTESLEVQCSLIAAVESMGSAEITSISLSVSLGDVTGLSS
jgi:hypothetical protein